MRAPTASTPPAPTQAAMAAWTVALVVGLLAFGAIAWGVTHHQLLLWDVEMLLRLHARVPDSLQHPAAVVSKLTEPVAQVAVALVLSLVLYGRGARWAAVMLACDALGAALLTFGLKDLFRQPRPELFETAIVEHSYGFPSGHALVTTGLLAFVCLLAGLRWPKARLGWNLTAVLAVLVIGGDRLVLGVHWPSDVLGGAALGLAWLAFCWLVYRRLGGRRSARLSR